PKVFSTTYKYPFPSPISKSNTNKNFKTLTRIPCFPPLSQHLPKRTMAATNNTNKTEVKLLGAWPSPFVMRPRIALNIKSVEYDFLEEQFGSKSELLLKSNPVHKKMPVLLHNDTPICESSIIVEYIDDVWSSGPSILPSDPYERAIARFWTAYIDEKWFPSVRAALIAPSEEAKTAAKNQLIEVLALLEQAYKDISKGKDFFGGDRIGFVDIAFGSMLGWTRGLEVMMGVKLLDQEKTPGLLKWSEKFAADPAVKDVLPETEKLLQFAKLLVVKLKGDSA
ncbi:Glutathione S-transferase U17, partial [Linum grandiflorum]